MKASTGLRAAPVQLGPGDPLYPPLLDAQPTITYVGNIELLRKPSIGLFCSVQCPGRLVNETYRLAQRLRDAGITVVGGFHSPMERECLRLLFSGSQPLIICPARGIQSYRIPSEWQHALSARLLVLSPFGPDERRVTSELAQRRNRFVGALATEVFIAYAAPESATLSFAHSLAAGGKPLLTHGAAENTPLLELGARAITDTDYPARADHGQMPLFDQ